MVVDVAVKAYVVQLSTLTTKIFFILFGLVNL